jgi:Cu-processing system ATP-binding protein
MIIATNVSKSFGKLSVLQDISTTCHAGQSIALIGPNGSGKTTFIKCLLGMVVPDSGFITFDGKNIGKDWQYRDRIGYMPQTGRYPDHMTIGQVLDMMTDLRGKRRGDLDRELIVTWQLDAMLGKRMGTLSGGTRQKVSAALAFLFRPDVLILDEPTAGLDPLSSEMLKDKIRREREQGRLILITSHVLSDLEDIISEIIYLQDGRLVFHKAWETLREDTGEVRLSRAIAQVMKKAN